MIYPVYNQFYNFIFFHSFLGAHCYLLGRDQRQVINIHFRSASYFNLSTGLGTFGTSIIIALMHRKHDIVDEDFLSLACGSNGKSLVEAFLDLYAEL